MKHTRKKFCTVLGGRHISSQPSSLCHFTSLHIPKNTLCCFRRGSWRCMHDATHWSVFSYWCKAALHRVYKQVGSLTLANVWSKCSGYLCCHIQICQVIVKKVQGSSSKKKRFKPKSNILLTSDIRSKEINLSLYLSMCVCQSISTQQSPDMQYCKL